MFRLALIALLLAPPVAAAEPPVSCPRSRVLFDGRCVSKRQARKLKRLERRQRRADERCRTKKTACHELGHCTGVVGRRACVAGDDNDCRGARVCATEGQCTAKDGKCVASDDGSCRGSAACGTYGRCTAALGQCVSSRAEDCQKSKRCSSDCWCGHEGTACTYDEVCMRKRQNARCATQPVCTRSGKCTGLRSQFGWQCVVGSDADCIRSERCAAEGRCSRSTGGLCTAANDADCAKTVACQQDGRCTASKGRCTVGSDTDCARSPACRNAGRCTFDGGHGRGFCALRSDADCQRTVGCAAQGLCTFDSMLDECRAGSDASCAASTECATSGLCQEREGRCVASTWHRTKAWFSSLTFWGVARGVGWTLLVVAVLGLFGWLSNGAGTSSGSSSSSYSGGSSSYSTVDKSCGRCGGSVSLAASAGESCPHCGAHWGSVTNRYM